MEGLGTSPETESARCFYLGCVVLRVSVGIMGGHSHFWEAVAPASFLGAARRDEPEETCLLQAPPCIVGGGEEFR